jgi:hypothetical protein
MGIIYQCKIRCFKVKDTSKVDLNPLEANVKHWKSRLNQYYLSSKENIDEVLAVYKHFPGLKRGYRIINIPIPEGTNVIAFGNEACDRRDAVIYDINFYNKNHQKIKYLCMGLEWERNNFMVLCPENTSYIYYGINEYESYPQDIERLHDFNFKDFCEDCGPASTSESSFSDYPEEFETESENESEPEILGPLEPRKYEPIIREESFPDTNSPPVLREELPTANEITQDQSCAIF